MYTASFVFHCQISFLHALSQSAQASVVTIVPCCESSRALLVQVHARYLQQQLLQLFKAKAAGMALSRQQQQALLTSSWPCSVYKS